MAETFLPKWIAWEVTQRCNLRCIHCRCSAEITSAQGDFNTDEAFSLLDQIVELTKPVVVLSGGEPLLRPDVFQLARRGTEHPLEWMTHLPGTPTGYIWLRNEAPIPPP